MLIRMVDMVRVSQMDASLPPDICTWPFAGIGGMGHIVATVMIGRHMTILARFNLPEWVEAVQRHRPSFVSGPPAVAQIAVDETGIASCTESVWLYVSIYVYAVSLKQTKHTTN